MGLRLQQVYRRDLLSTAVPLQAVSIGPTLNHDAVVTGVVHSSFPHALNMVVGDDLWTLLSLGKSDLPFGIRVAADTLAGLPICPGDRVSVRGGFLAVGMQGVVVDFRAAPHWRVSPPARLAPGIEERLAIVARATAANAWSESSNIAFDVMTYLANKAGVPTDLLTHVVGRGPGLTPAGDDVLAGILAILALPQTGDRGHAARTTLTRLLRTLLPMTTSLSGSLLQQAAAGQFSKAVHELLFTLVAAPSIAELMRAIANMLTIGATSGADTCMGIVAAARNFLAPTAFGEAA
ncbi:MAG TPA: DUF2877 domain-containing protein [Acetobacteraceae bacterium]|nr:DUF2877 domain-containing protein [Acetobacteraceae bacterium]